MLLLGHQIHSEAAQSAADGESHEQHRRKQGRKGRYREHFAEKRGLS